MSIQKMGQTCDSRSIMDKKMSCWHKIFRLFGWWLGLSSLYAMFSVCPFCGRQGCPVGAGSAGVVGGILTLFLQNWRHLIRHLRMKFFKNSGNKENHNC
ncbi:MAG: hypothetical protein ABIL20_02270 [candidate division WOR-3 bacterium]